MADISSDNVHAARPTIPRRHVHRGSLLSTYLALWFAVSMVGIVIQLFAWDAIAASTPPGLLLALRIAILLRPFSIVAIWFWSRTGVLALILLTMVLAGVEAVGGFTIGIFSLLGLVILIVLVRPIWSFMYWGLARRSRVVPVDDEED